MKFVRYRRGAQTGVGVLDLEGGVVRPVVAAIGADDSLIGLIEKYMTEGPTAIEVEQDTELDIAELQLLAPIPRPARNIICVGKNYKEHSAEFARSGYDSSATPDEEVPAHPIVFTKPSTTVIGPDDQIDPHLDLTDALDYEAEVGVIVGRGGRSITAEESWDHIWGYTLLNDVTARDLQQRHKQWFIGKSLDTFCPMGPWVVTADEVRGDQITIECRVNGELRQQATTGDLIFDIPTLISTLSAGITLEPGDVIATGTPAGVGLGSTPPKFLKPGDTVVVSSPELGELSNRVADAAEPSAATA